MTKYLAGHSDLIQGAVLARDAGVFEPIKFLQNATGAVPSPFDCWLTLRGLKTLELRMQRHAENAAAIAEALCGHPRVRRVYYPGLPSHPGHDVARRQMTGFGGMVSFELDGIGRRGGVVRVVAAVLRARREPRRRQVARLSPGADDARLDPGRERAQRSVCRTRSSGCRRGARTTATW